MAMGLKYNWIPIVMGNQKRKKVKRRRGATLWFFKLIWILSLALWSLDLECWSFSSFEYILAFLMSHKPYILCAYVLQDFVDLESIWTGLTHTKYPSSYKNLIFLLFYQVLLQKFQVNMISCHIKLMFTDFSCFWIDWNSTYFLHLWHCIVDLYIFILNLSFYFHFWVSL